MRLSPGWIFQRIWSGELSEAVDVSLNTQKPRPQIFLKFFTEMHIICTPHLAYHGAWHSNVYVQDSHFPENAPKQTKMDTQNR